MLWERVLPVKGTSLAPALAKAGGHTWRRLHPFFHRSSHLVNRSL